MTITTERNVYTGQTFDVCAKHDDAKLIGDCQTQHGGHEGMCEFCESPQLETLMDHGRISHPDEQ